MRILITGSRDWDKPSVIMDALVMETSKVDNFSERITVVHGGAAGADIIAERLAEVLRCDTEAWLADWDKYGKSAGFVRNSKMVNLGADICLAFIKNESRGATMCADLAEKAGIPVKRFIID